MQTATHYGIICQTGNGDPPPKKPPTETPTRRQTDQPAEKEGSK